VPLTIFFSLGFAKLEAKKKDKIQMALQKRKELHHLA
jgi:hypothetical protein